MKTKTYKCWGQTYKAYVKKAGKGYEVGFMHGTKPLFVGNFISQKETQTWYKLMNREFSHFVKKYWHNSKATSATAFYNKFISNNLYKHYYDYLDKCFGQYTKTYHREFTRDIRTYNRMKKHWTTKESTPYTRRAA